tara:strand:- start:42 stop:224 length:183 start_codon:yes stop_codon:yes gene_type:complete
MRFLGCLLFGLFMLSCNSQNNKYKKIEEPVFSKEEQKIINTHFKPDTTNTKIESVKIQTH